MPSMETLKIESDGENVISKQDIADYFSKHVGILDNPHLEAFRQIPPREAFDLLIASDLKSPFFAISLMREIPCLDTIDLLLDLRGESKYTKEIIQHIDWILFQFTHMPEVSDQAIKALKELGDSRVTLPLEDGSIEMVTEEVIPDIIALNIPMVRAEGFLEDSCKQGAVFTLRNDDRDLQSFAVAHQVGGYTLYVDYIFTDENRRKQGCARELMNYLIKYHTILECDLFRGDMLSRKTLEELGFKHEGPGDKWVYRVKSND